MTIEEAKEVGELELLEYVMERPGHPEQFGFMTPVNIMKNDSESSEKLMAIMLRLNELPKDVIKAAIKRRVIY